MTSYMYMYRYMTSYIKNSAKLIYLKFKEMLEHLDAYKMSYKCRCYWELLIKVHDLIHVQVHDPIHVQVHDLIHVQVHDPIHVQVLDLIHVPFSAEVAEHVQVTKLIWSSYSQSLFQLCLSNELLLGGVHGGGRGQGPWGTHHDLVHVHHHIIASYMYMYIPSIT